MSKTLEQWTPEEIAAKATELHRTYGAVGGLREYRVLMAGLRQECFERLASTMDPDGLLTDWVEQMEAQMVARFAPRTARVQMLGVEYSWPAVLGIARYGLAPGHWPARFTAEDVHRAKRWLYQGAAPEGITYIVREG